MSMRAITVSREYGSGGGEIARSLAEKLAWSLLDHQVVKQVASQLGISEREAAVHDEHVEGFTQRLLESMRYSRGVLSSGVFPTEENESAMVVDDRTYNAALRQVLLTAYELGKVVIVGRGAQAILKPYRDVLRIFVVAPLDKRIAYVMEREGLSETAARNRIRRKDHDRGQAFREFYRDDPRDVHLYDLVINTDVLDLQAAVDLSILALERKESKLALPEEKLGPKVGLSPYPGRPGDLPIS
jgi:cytidylate kinase